MESYAAIGIVGFFFGVCTAAICYQIFSESKGRIESLTWSMNDWRRLFINRDNELTKLKNDTDQKVKFFAWSKKNDPTKFSEWVAGEKAKKRLGIK